MDELVSAIVPIYNTEKYLRQCIESIINQTYKNIEIILVNDGSTDSSSEICNEYENKDKRIKVIHKENAGVSSARNIGIEESQGKWITFIDSDDWVEKDYIERMYYLAANQSVDIVLCSYNRVLNNKVDKIDIINSANEVLNGYEYLIKSLNPQTGFGFCSMKLIKRKCINVIFDEKLVVSEDAFFNIQLSRNIKKAFVINEHLYNYRNNNESVVKKYDANYPNKYLNSMNVIKKYIIKQYGNNLDIIQNLNNFIVYHLMLVCVNYCYHPDNGEKNKRKLLKQICNKDEFKESIKKSNYNNISTTRKITLFTLKHKLYFVTELICKYRQMQNMKG